MSPRDLKTERRLNAKDADKHRIFGTVWNSRARIHAAQNTSRERLIACSHHLLMKDAKRRCARNVKRTRQTSGNVRLNQRLADYRKQENLLQKSRGARIQAEARPLIIESSGIAILFLLSCSSFLLYILLISPIFSLLSFHLARLGIAEMK